MIPGPNLKRDLSKIFICNSGTRRQDVEQLHDPNFAAYVIPLLLAPCVRDGGQVVCLIDYAALGHSHWVHNHILFGIKV